MTLRRFIEHSLRNILTPKPLSGKEAQDAMIKLLQSDQPCFIGRFGAFEIRATCYAQPSKLPGIIRNWLRPKLYLEMLNNAGFFPVNEDTLSKFSELMKSSMKTCDILGSWRYEEFIFRKELSHSRRVKRACLDPVQIKEYPSWYSCLKGKKILVISPFKELIEQQMGNQPEKIWPQNPDILPGWANFTIIKAVNSIGGNCEFDSWFEALEYMERQIDKVDFDIAILGCGAYGFPLAAYIKSIGKKAIHVGGATQLIFGIKGKRWEDKSFINEYWISPRPQDRPKGFEKVEGGCYW